MGVQQQRSAQPSTPRPVAFNQPFGTLVRLVDRLDAAIRIEEREVARAGGTQYRVRYAERCEGVGGSHQYRLTVDGHKAPLKLQGDVTLLRSDKPVASGRILRTEDQFAWIATEDLGNDLGGLVLRSEVDWLWAVLRRRLRVLWPGKGPFLSKGSITPRDGLIVDLLNARGGPRANPLRPTPLPDDLNPEQRNAVGAILKNAVTYLWGPPGTGKTTTLAAAVADLVRAGRTVLVVTPSNAAGDVAAARIAERLSLNPDFDCGLVVRHGSGAGGRLRSQWGDRLIASEISQRLEREASYTCGEDPNLLLDRAAALEKCLGGLTGSRAPTVCPMLKETGRRVVRSLRLRACASGSSERVRVGGTGVVRDAAVVVTTAHQLCFENGACRMYDTVIIDEASQASLPLVLLAAAHAREAIVVAGDPRQLPPTVQSRDRESKKLLGEDAFSLSGAISRTGSGVTCLLATQHRMAPEISDLVSTVWYGATLRPHTSVLQRPKHPVCRYYGSLLYVDTSRLHSRVALTKGKSRQNPAHVEVVRSLISRLFFTGLLPRSSTVLITSPFTAQTSQLARALPRCTASTVHALQGGEADLVVLDLTDAPGAEVSGFLAADAITDEGGRLLNVAASRARHAVIVVAHFDHLGAEGGQVVRELLRYIKGHGRSITNAFASAPLLQPRTVDRRFQRTLQVW